MIQLGNARPAPSFRIARREKKLLWVPIFRFMKIAQTDADQSKQPLWAQLDPIPQSQRDCR
jgi:hypothetical protein